MIHLILASMCGKRENKTGKKNKTKTNIFSTKQPTNTVGLNIFI